MENAVENEEGSESGTQKQAAQAHQGRQNDQGPAKTVRTALRQRAGCRREQRQVGNCGGEAQLEQGLVRPT